MTFRGTLPPLRITDEAPRGDGIQVIMFVYGSGESDPRVHREAIALAGVGYTVTAIGLRRPGEADTEVFSWGKLIRVGAADTRRTINAANPLRRGSRHLLRIRQAAWLVRYAALYRRWRDEAVREALALVPRSDPVVWHGHDLTGLVPAAASKRLRGGCLIYDSHELYLESGSLTQLPKPIWRLLFRYERSLARQADRIITVSESFARELAERYGVPRPSLVMNCPPLGLLPAASPESPLRAIPEIKDKRILVIHGVIAPGKGVLESVEALRHLPEQVVLVFFGAGSLEGRVRELVSDGPLAGRCFIHAPVPQSELLRWLHGADAAICAFTAEQLSHYYTLPNRLFEALGAGVPVVTSDFPETRAIVERYDVGVLCDPRDPRSIAHGAVALLDERAAERSERRARCRRVVEESYNWERQAAVLLDVYAQLRTPQRSLAG